MAAQTHLFNCRSDNYGVLLHDPETGATASIDAPEAAAVEAALQKTGWKLTDILVTHHHADHTDGIVALKDKYKCRVVAPAAEAAKIAGVDETVKQGDTVKVGNLVGKVIETPGHTLGHIVYWFDADNIVFAADNLFSAGCGRVIEGTMDQMWGSMRKMLDLPDETKIFCGHEYTLANIKFALSVDKDNAALKARAEQAEKQIAAGQPTIPTTIGEEKKINPFLRPNELAAGLGMAGKPANEVFAEIRTRKNKF
ncbi:MAG: hydroxyacylglutathione hydrolase [Pseudolabrys sp.]|nr:hydroxyacylglutathione hydrolase [Pseudolabrys sp.]